MQEMAEGKWGSKTRRPPRERTGVTGLGRRHRRDWQSRYNIPGLWFEVDEQEAATNPEEELEELRLHIYQLFERHPLLNKEIVNTEGAAPRWHVILPVLRQMELAGELIGGKLCNEMPGLQFCPSEDDPPAPPETGELWFWLNSYDPALLPNPVNNKKGEHNYLLFFAAADEAAAFAVVKNRGKDLELIGDSPLDKAGRAELLPEILTAFFRMAILENTGQSARILTVDSNPVKEHPLHEALKQRGFIEDRQGLVLWKY